MKPVCVPCQRFFRMKKTGYYFTEMMPTADAPRRPEPGTAHPEHWTPYKVWAGDLWECEGCGAKIISGTGQDPVVEHYYPDFDLVSERLNARELTVNDC